MDGVVVRRPSKNDEHHCSAGPKAGLQKGVLRFDASTIIHERNARLRACEAPLLLVAPMRQTPAATRRNPHVVRIAISSYVYVTHHLNVDRAGCVPRTILSHFPTSWSQCEARISRSSQSTLPSPLISPATIVSQAGWPKYDLLASAVPP